MSDEVKPEFRDCYLDKFRRFTGNRRSRTLLYRLDRANNILKDVDLELNKLQRAGLEGEDLFFSTLDLDEKLVGCMGDYLDTFFALGAPMKDIVEFVKYFDYLVKEIKRINEPYFTEQLEKVTPEARERYYSGLKLEVRVPITYHLPELSDALP